MSLINTITSPSIILLVASPRGGKSHTIKYLLHSFCMQGRFSHGIVFSGSIQNKDYSFIPQQYVHPFSEDVLKQFLLIQKTYTMPAFLVLDDLLGACNWNSQLMTHLLTTYRHYKLTILIATQYVQKIPPAVRNCVTFACIFNQSNKRSIDSVYESFLYDFNNVKQAQEFINSNCKGYYFILVNISEVEFSKKYKLYIAPARLSNTKIIF